MSNVVRVFKNSLAFDKWIFVLIQNGNVNKVKEFDCVYGLYDSNERLLGYNINDKENLFKDEANGYIVSSIQLQDKVNTYLNKSGLSLIQFDLTSYFKVGEIISYEKVDGSDHLNICQVDIKSEILQIVCGAKNVKENIKVVVALDGAILPDGKLIEKGQLRGIDSQGMLCSAYELKLSEKTNQGILIVEKQEVGESFKR